MRLLSPRTAADGWVISDGSRRRARLVSWVRHPHMVLSRAVSPRRGVPTGRPVPVGANEVLERLGELPLSVWTYGFDDATVRHMGPMAQDFATAFGLGDSTRRIDMVDANGVVMAACQALHRRVVALEAEVVALRQQHAAAEAGRREPG